MVVRREEDAEAAEAPAKKAKVSHCVAAVYLFVVCPMWPMSD